MLPNEVNGIDNHWHCRVASMKLYYIYNSVTAFDLTGRCNNIMYFRLLLCYWVGMSIFERKSGQYYVSVEKNCTKCQMLQLYHKMLKKSPVALKKKKSTVIFIDKFSEEQTYKKMCPLRKSLFRKWSMSQSGMTKPAW